MIDNKITRYYDLTEGLLKEASYGMYKNEVTFNNMIRTLFKQQIIDKLDTDVKYCSIEELDKLLIRDDLKPEVYFTFISNKGGTNKNNVSGMIQHHIIYKDNPKTFDLFIQKHTSLHNKINSRLINKVENSLKKVYEEYYQIPYKEYTSKKTYADDIFKFALFENCIRVMGHTLKEEFHINLNDLKIEINQEEFDKYIKSNELNEQLLVELKRGQLITKSKQGKEYSKKNQSKGKNRWERRKHSQLANSIRDYNQIDMNSFFKEDIIEFIIKVKGETDDYLVTITFEHILRNLQQEIKSNNNKLEFKCVLRALLKAFNGEDVYVSCTCKDFAYRFAYHSTQNHYNSGKPELRPNRFISTNSKDDMGSGCKHINLVLSNTDWMMKIASVINNYIKWCKDNMSRNYADIIFPAVYGMKYDKAVQLSIFDDPNDNGLLPDDQETMKQVLSKTLKGRDEKGKWTSSNEYKFQKQDTVKSKQKYPEDDPDQLHLDLKFDTIKKKQLKLDDEGEEIDDKHK